jgi:serine/threonine protein kinase
MHNNRKRLVLGDLGLAKDLNLNKSLSSFTTVGIVYYKAPEFFNQDSDVNYTEKIDIWY